MHAVPSVCSFQRRLPLWAIFLRCGISLDFYADHRRNTIFKQRYRRRRYFTLGMAQSPPVRQADHEQDRHGLNRNRLRTETAVPLSTTTSLRLMLLVLSTLQTMPSSTIPTNGSNRATTFVSVTLLKNPRAVLVA